jgi:hypothetical protein
MPGLRGRPGTLGAIAELSFFAECEIDLANSANARIWQVPKSAQKLAKYESRPAPRRYAHARVEDADKPARIAEFTTLV